MRAASIHQGEDYAYSRYMGYGGGPADHLLKATVLARPVSGKVLVRIEHPDPHVEDLDAHVETRKIVGRWDDQPTDESNVRTDDRPDEEQPPPPEGRDRLPYWDRLKLTCAEHAAKRYAEVLAQRATADRLTALGIDRRHAHYSGLGGAQRGWAHGLIESTNVREFTSEERDRLLNLAEAGQRAPETVAYLVSDLETREGAPERTVIGAHVSLLDLDHYDVAQRDAAEPDKVTQLMTHGAELRVYRVVRDS